MWTPDISRSILPRPNTLHMPCSLTW